MNSQYFLGIIAIVMFQLLCVQAKANVHTVEGKLLGFGGRERQDISAASVKATVQLKGQNVDFQTFVTKDGSFAFHEVPSGPFLLEVLSAQDYYAPVRVDVSAKNGQIRAFKASNTSHNVGHPMRLELEGKKDYFMVREGFQITSMLKNPMLLMMGFTLLMTFFLPKLMNGLDPEALQELQGGQAAQKEPPTKWLPPPITNNRLT